MNQNEMNNGLFNTLNEILPKFEKIMDYSPTYETREYLETIKIAMEKKYNAFSICLTFDLMLAAFLNKCSISLVDLVLERDQDAVDCVKISKEIINTLEKSNYYTQKSETFKKMRLFLDDVYRKNTKIDNYFDKGEKMFEILKFHFLTISDMELHQFFKGESTDIKPHYIRNINCFRTMDEAVRVMSKIPVNFIALVGVKDENSREIGYFAYIVKNGENLFAFSDINRSEGNNGLFTADRNTYRDLMPYVHLKEFKYVWWYEDAFGIMRPLNEDKYHVALNNKDWSSFTLNELEDNEILLQYFMFDYVNNLLFKEKPKVNELTYTSQSLALTYKGKTINKSQLPILASDLNKTEYELPKLDEILDQIAHEMYKDYLKQMKRGFENSYECERWWSVQEEAIENVRNKIQKQPLELIYFELNKDEVIDAKGKQAEVAVDVWDKREPWLDVISGITNNFFGTKSQYRSYTDNLFYSNLSRLIKKEYEKIIKSKVPAYVRFLNYLLSEKFRERVVEATLLDALTEKKNSTIRHRGFREPDMWRENKSWEDAGLNLWLYWKYRQSNQMSYKEYEEGHCCVLNGSKSCVYKVSLQINHIDEMKRIWTFINKEEVPDFMKIHNYYTATRSAGVNSSDVNYVSIFGSGEDSIYWISKSGLKAFCRTHGIDFDEALNKIEKSNYY
ncbi:hypothetical protein [Breznakia pachnodae]|uniref:Uncharacterized protein n=1 Tax=Breznakia pachnodae TaxID=265178 RepID=A0ABU0E3Y7_9FIRM|nr:hypothetical protein [Breznakia pachnodae]MDQ0361621.1 hypothetical protein [Breznakia pachnodae]